MADGEAGSCPQVFVLDAQSNGNRKQRNWATGLRGSQQVLLLLVGMVVLALFVQGVFIYDLYKKTKALSHSTLNHRNLSDAKAISQQGDAVVLSQMGSPDLNQIQILQLYQQQEEKRPFAHLTGSTDPVGENNVLQWIHNSGDSMAYHMHYDRGTLQVEREGYYYVYSKVHLNTKQNCSHIKHVVKKNTTAYGEPIELLKSKSVRVCLPKKSQEPWNNFLCGIFHLKAKDKIYVTLDSWNQNQNLCGSTDNFMGAFMVVPWKY